MEVRVSQVRVSEVRVADGTGTVACDGDARSQVSSPNLLTFNFSEGISAGSGDKLLFLDVELIGGLKVHRVTELSTSVFVVDSVAVVVSK